MQQTILQNTEHYQLNLNLLFHQHLELYELQFEQRDRDQGTQTHKWFLTHDEFDQLKQAIQDYQLKIQMQQLEPLTKN